MATLFVLFLLFGAYKLVTAAAKNKDAAVGIGKALSGLFKK